MTGTFDNFLRFSIYRLDYSNLLMSTTVCSSACRRYEPIVVAVTLSYFPAFIYYKYWLIFSGSHLHILVSFYPSLLCLYAFCIFLFRFCSSLFCLCMCTLWWFFQRFCSHFPKIHRRGIIFETFMTSICEKKLWQKYGLFMQNECLYIISLF